MQCDHVYRIPGSVYVRACAQLYATYACEWPEHAGPLGVETTTQEAVFVQDEFCRDPCRTRWMRYSCFYVAILFESLAWPCMIARWYHWRHKRSHLPHYVRCLFDHVSQMRHYTVCQIPYLHVILVLVELVELLAHGTPQLTKHSCCGVALNPKRVTWGVRWFLPNRSGSSPSAQNYKYSQPIHHPNNWEKIPSSASGSLLPNSIKEAFPDFAECASVSNRIDSLRARPSEHPCRSKAKAAALWTSFPVIRQLQEHSLLLPSGADRTRDFGQHSQPYSIGRSSRSIFLSAVALLVGIKRAAGSLFFRSNALQVRSTVRGTLAGRRRRGTRLWQC